MRKGLAGHRAATGYGGPSAPRDREEESAGAYMCGLSASAAVAGILEKAPQIVERW